VFIFVSESGNKSGSTNFMKNYFKISYLLRESAKDKHGNCPLYIRSQQNSDKRLLYNTGIRLHTDQWHSKKNVPKNKPAKLMELELQLSNAYDELFEQGLRPNLNDIVKYMNDGQSTAAKPDSTNILEAAEIFLKKGKASYGVSRGVKTMIHRLGLFKKDLRFAECTKNVLTDFVDDMNARGIQNNSAYKSIRSLYVVAEDVGENLPVYKMPTTYQRKNATVPRLTVEEVKSILALKTETTVERVALEVFELACYTGLRISDLLTLQEGELNDGYYEKLQEKTGEYVYVTVQERNTALLSKYFESGIPYTRQVLSRALKAVLKRSALEKKTTRISFIGSKLKKQTKKEWEGVAYHICRRFYASLLSQLSLSTQIISDELGHITRSVTAHYVGSAEHRLRIKLVRDAILNMDKSLQAYDALMKVA
jgi:integrase